MTWRYVMSRSRNDGGDCYEIREYYELVDPTGDVEHTWTVDPVKPFGETPVELAQDLARMLMATKSGEILDLTLDPPALVKTASRSCPYCGGSGWDAGCGDDKCCRPGPCQSCKGEGASR